MHGLLLSAPPNKKTFLNTIFNMRKIAQNVPYMRDCVVISKFWGFL